MDIWIVLLGSFFLLLYSAVKGYFLAYPLFTAFMVLFIVLMRRGFRASNLVQKAFRSSQKAFSVIVILLLIGIVIAVWLAAGTVPALVYYGIQWIQPHYFVLSAFVLTSLVSFVLGTSFGTVGTIGIALMIMARSSDMNPALVAGAIIAGAYVGDRCSPMSSSANLIASLTRTDLYCNLRTMLWTGWLPLLLTCLIYGLLSWWNPAELTDSRLAITIDETFHIQPLLLLPALVVVLLSILRIEVQWSMILSALVGGAIALSIQQVPFLALLKFSLLGFHLPETSTLATIIGGGGFLAMTKVCLIVVISTALVGLLAELHLLRRIETWLASLRSRSHVFLGTTLLGTVAAAFGCTQTIAILLTQQLVERKYEEKPLNRDKLAIDLENTVVVISPLIPWNIAGLVPATILMSDARFIPYAVYLYLLPLISWLQFRLIELFQTHYATNASGKR
jgi:NhaC family Na+:H+ antiporter